MKRKREKIKKNCEEVYNAIPIGIPYKGSLLIEVKWEKEAKQMMAP